MKRVFGILLLTSAVAASSQNRQLPQVWSGRLSDGMCASSHQRKMAEGNLSERECVFECIKALGQFVLVDDKEQVFRIANQDLGGLPLYAGRLVSITGELKNGAIVASKVEAIPAHLHLGHVMTNWRDTPANVGFLTAALSEAKSAATQAELAVKSRNQLDEMKMHAGDVLHTLDPSVEPKGAGNAYGVKKAIAGAIQHLELATNAEGASNDLKAHASQVSASLKDALQWTDQAIAAANKIRAANSAPEAAPFADEAARLTRQISDTALQQAKAGMMAIMKAEGIENAPR
jgi:hypothetical protein